MCHSQVIKEESACRLQDYLRRIVRACCEGDVCALTPQLRSPFPGYLWAIC
jgi:hypothetical protein